MILPLIQGNIQTNTNDIATNTAAIALKQNANAETTLRYRIVPLSIGVKRNRFNELLIKYFILHLLLLLV